MILTVTPNPSLDYLFETDRLVWDDANRVDSPRLRPGGQGINVTRAVRALGESSVAVALLGGSTGDELERFLNNEGTGCERITIAGATRVFFGVRERESGRSMLVNPRGPAIAADEEERIDNEISQAISRARPSWVAGCGSIPPGLSEEFYARVAIAARSVGARFVPDCDGQALRCAFDHADLIVPNQHEAERLAETGIADLKAAGKVARDLAGRGPKLVAITLGAEGAVLTDGTFTWYAAPPAFTHGSAVGAGDAFLAALLVSLQSRAAPQDALCTAVAAGAAVLCSRGSDLLTTADVRRLATNVRARPLD
ncbi:MAG: hexose kinase [Gemmatimonadota bacterium]